jgi:hypothetical protein
MVRRLKEEPKKKQEIPNSGKPGTAPRVSGPATDVGTGPESLGQNGQAIPAADAAGARLQPGENRKILVAGLQETFTEAAVDYAINLAERLGYEIIGLSVNPELTTSGGFLTPYKRHLREEFKKRVDATSAGLRQKVAAKGLRFEHLVGFGDLGKAIEDVNHQIKRIEFVITDAKVDADEVTGVVNLPVFSIKGSQGERIMAEHLSRSTRPIGKTIAFGVAAAALYAAVFTNSDTVMHYFTKGGWFAALPIATVFAVSFVHGAFANYLWAALGIEAPKKVVQPRPETKRPVRRQRPRPELRLNA